ncbi:uncharacterized protein LOC110454428 [Mizuhopecten yessoensis]|uniref:Fibronectin type-III domain-containing protein n=1 Tax=Mizuhopecten yessoensis TaxID=6573 RepID=A0A210R449_MIZYE|nr:uncharacterized protein LOC110454428 [Mizuhopecten yessoensis]OWF55840.1 hypothetical protein KP79_PYT11620 [Mizuhopecten yessoensis]
MTHFTGFGLSLVLWLFNPVSCSLTCNSTCTAIDHNVNVTFACTLLEIPEETDSWVPECGPDKPSQISCDQVHINNKTQLGFSWHPPGDSSAKDITGFRILIFITNTGNFYPRKSYRMNLTEWKAYLTHPQSTFTLRCLFDEEGDRQYVPVFAHVFSLPKSSKKLCTRNSSSCEKKERFTPATVHTVTETVHTVTETKTGLGIYIGVPAALVVFLVSAILAFRWFRTGKRKSCSVSHIEERNGHNSVSTISGEPQFTQTVPFDPHPGLRTKRDIDAQNFECFKEESIQKHGKDLKVFISSELQLEEIPRETFGRVGNDDTGYSSGSDRVCPVHGYSTEAKHTVPDLDYSDCIPPLSDEATQRVALSLAAFNEKSENHQ